MYDKWMSVQAFNLRSPNYWLLPSLCSFHLPVTVRWGFHWWPDDTVKGNMSLCFSIKSSLKPSILETLCQLSAIAISFWGQRNGPSCVQASLNPPVKPRRLKSLIIRWADWRRKWTSFEVTISKQSLHVCRHLISFPYSSFKQWRADRRRMHCK